MFFLRIFINMIEFQYQKFKRVTFYNCLNNELLFSHFPVVKACEEW